MFSIINRCLLAIQSIKHCLYIVREDKHGVKKGKKMRMQACFQRKDIANTSVIDIACKRDTKEIIKLKWKI
jgi:hypothetical protein